MIELIIIEVFKWPYTNMDDFMESGRIIFWYLNQLEGLPLPNPV